MLPRFFPRASLHFVSYFCFRWKELYNYSFGAFIQLLFLSMFISGGWPSRFASKKVTFFFQTPPRPAVSGEGGQPAATQIVPHAFNWCHPLPFTLTSLSPPMAFTPSRKPPPPSHGSLPFHPQLLPPSQALFPCTHSNYPHPRPSLPFTLQKYS